MTTKPDSWQKVDGKWVKPEQPAANTAANTWSTLAGKFFHELCSAGRVQKQGMVEAVIDQLLVVRYFEWISGSTDWGTYLVPLQRAVDGRWIFYETAEQMRSAYKYSGLWSHGEPWPRCEHLEPEPDPVPMPVASVADLVRLTRAEPR